MALGGTNVGYAQWKAKNGLVAVVGSWGLSLVFLVKILCGCDYLSGRWLLIVLAIMILSIGLNRLWLSSKERQAEYERTFKAWPVAKRKAWDVAVGFVVLMTFATLIYLANKARLTRP